MKGAWIALRFPARGPAAQGKDFFWVALRHDSAGRRSQSSLRPERSSRALTLVTWTEGWRANTAKSIGPFFMMLYLAENYLSG
jgi:hypothetical protein